MPTEFLDRFEVPELLRLPAWADPQVVRSASTVAIVVSLIALVLAIRIIRRLLLRAVVVVVLRGAVRIENQTTFLVATHFQNMRLRAHMDQENGFVGEI